MIIQTDKVLPERRAYDFYPTPINLCEAALGKLKNFNHQSILDPGAGEGAWGIAAHKLFSRAAIIGIEFRDVPQPNGYHFWKPRTDYMMHTFPAGTQFDLVMGNPPFYCAEEFVRKSLSLLCEGGVLMFLLPTQFFFSSKKRVNGLFKDFPLTELSGVGRVSFTDNGKTNATDYALYIWIRDTFLSPRLQTTVLTHLDWRA